MTIAISYSQVKKKKSIKETEFFYKVQIRNYRSKQKNKEKGFTRKIINSL